MNAYVERPIPIIDLFAGPGGLGEGFTSVTYRNKRVFQIALSIERDEHAHQTLTLRSFLRQFPFKKLPPEYYQFVRGEIMINQLYDAYPAEIEEAKKEAWKFELGKSENHSLIDSRIRKALKGEENFVLIGGPPCQAYSLVGRARRQEGKGLKKEDERVYLYREYYRILAEHKPAVFIMENVKGILSSRVEKENLFTQIIDDLQDPIAAYKKLKGKNFYKSKKRYKIYSLVHPVSNLFEEYPVHTPNDFVIRSEDYGIPQTRHRVILLGVRSDLNIAPTTLTKFGNHIPIDKVLSGLPRLRSGLSKTIDGNDEWLKALTEIKTENIKSEIDADVWKQMEATIDKLTIPEEGKGKLFVKFKAKVRHLSDWYLDKSMQGVANHESRTHIKQDLHRYLFVSCFATVKKRSPKLFEFPPSLMPKHQNVNDGKFTDRFRVQSFGQPGKTVTSHISKDGHYFIHPDSTQCRSLTVREAARVQTFPDNYFFCGPRTEQFHQVGNAVPPYLAKQIGEVVFDLFKGS